MRTRLFLLLVAGSIGTFGNSPVFGNDLEEYFHQAGPLAGTLKSDAPLPIYDADTEHLWNRMFAAFYIRPRLLPAEDGHPEMVRYEGGEYYACLETENPNTRLERRCLAWRFDTPASCRWSTRSKSDDFTPTSRFARTMVAMFGLALAGDLVLLPALLLGPAGRWFETGINAESAANDSPADKPARYRAPAA